MIGILVKFLEFMKIEADKLNSANASTNTHTNKTQESAQMIERDEKDNVFSEENEIITKFENGKVVQMSVITQTIPVSKNTAMKRTLIERIR